MNKFLNKKFLMISFGITLLMYPQILNLIVHSIQDVRLSFKLKEVQSSALNIDAPFQSKVIFIFDDGWESVYTEGYELLEQYNYPACVSIIPLLVGEEGYMDYTVLGELFLEDWEILNHSYSHKEDMYDYWYLLLKDFNKARVWMNTRGFDDTSQVAVIPYGKVNPYLIPMFQEEGYKSIRTSDNIILLDEKNPTYYPVRTINLLPDVTPEEVKEILWSSMAKGQDCIFILHQVTTQTPISEMHYPKAYLEEIVAFIHSNEQDLKVVTYSEFIDDVR